MVKMETIERQLPFNAVEDPKNFSSNLEKFCQHNGFEIESLELRNDMYIIRLRRPEQHGADSNGNLDNFDATFSSP